MNSGQLAPADNNADSVCNLFCRCIPPKLFSLIRSWKQSFTGTGSLDTVDTVDTVALAVGHRGENLQLIDANVQPLHE